MSVSTLTVILLLSGNPTVTGETQTTPQVTTAPGDQDAPAADAPAVPEPAAAAPFPAAPPLPTLPTAAAPAVAHHPADDDTIVVTARHRAPPGDPLEGVNLETYAVAQVTDKIVVAPAAKAYSKILPSPVRAGVRNFFNNLNEPVVFLNYLLQHKVGKAFETAGRFGINSTIGAAGLVDVAKHRPFHLPLRRNGFANTMGFYGVGPGPFLFIPLVGPTTVRDLLGLWADKLVLPATIGKPFNRIWYTVPSSIITSLDYRVEFDAQLRKNRESANPYAASRAAYLASRKAEIAALHIHRHHDPAPEPQTVPRGLPALPAPPVAPADTTGASPAVTPGP
ncbi:MAG TPA: VacJ family lipoprotein [Sphingobium sp.]|uniref:MlaA family lipoprotein n=1 Tax=Sphingobium sp. TaxID=1912891 RepID=UPI002ECFB5C9